ncbi:GC-rich sequence DNA-binding factor [Entomortierella chlamydospora]|nr:GC-rich sequence DNA-binding factor [Entomortierella chlamydospora]
MFTPRKNRNIRKKVDVEDDGLEEQTNIAPILESSNTPDSLAKPKKVKKKVASTALSFGDDEEEASEETFKVKKSSASRKLALNKGKDALLLDQPVNTITSRATVGNSTSYSKEALEELRKSTLSTTPSSKSYDNTGESLVEEKFPTSLGGHTIIPDAHAIHQAKKKREQMRLRNDRDEEEFISLAGGDDHTIVEEKNTRLVREEDDDMDDGGAELENVLGEKLELGTKAERKAQKIKRNARKELVENMEEDEEDEEETREWEMQQIRNAGIDKKERKKDRVVPIHKGVAFPTVTQIPNIANVRRRLQGHLENLKNQHDQHIKQLEQIRREEAGIVLRAAESDHDMAKASARYTFFQELRSYCRNLAAFFEEKFPELEAIERDYRTMLSERTKLVVERRGLDLKDDLAEFANVIDDGNVSGGSKDKPPEVDEFGRSIGVDPQAARKRRRADRDRRQALRKQTRAEGGDGTQQGNKDAENYDGLSTDDELGAGDDRELGEAVMELEDRRVNIFKEVGPEFRTIEAVKKHFQAWKTEYPKDYNKAYGGLLLPMVFDFFVRQETCLWNPLRVSQDISDQSWHRAVSSYAIHASASHFHSDSESDRDEEEEEDMDKELMSKVVAKSLCPKITQFLAAGGVDLYSTKQSQCLKAILDQLLDYVDKKDNKMDQLLKMTLQVILQTAQAHRDQFVEAAQPLTPRHILSAQGQQSRERYLWKTIGLFRNLMLLRRLVPAGSIDTPVVDGLLHDCILRLLEGDDKDTVVKYQMIFQALPHDIRSQERHLIIDRMAQNL